MRKHGRPLNERRNGVLPMMDEYMNSNLAT